MSSERTARRFFRGCVEIGTRQFGKGEMDAWMASFRDRPGAFARKALGSRWWSAQESVARAVATKRRVAVRSGHGVGKTYMAADLALWFLYAHRPSVVVTTAPTERQVEEVLWREIRERHAHARRALPGKLLKSKLELAEKWYAIGLTANSADSFQGFHAENLLIIMEEASGISDDIWNGAEGIAVGRNNRILAIGNPLRTSGRFFDIFRGEGWHKEHISALEHPNVSGQGRTIPAAVSKRWIDEKVEEWCEEVEGVGCRVSGARADDALVGQVGQMGRIGPCRMADLFGWNGKVYRPNDLFRIKVLGDFPDADTRGLISLRWIEEAMSRSLPETDYRRAAVDVAHYGDDDTVIGVRSGPVLIYLDAVHGADTVAVTKMVSRVAYEYHPAAIAVDAIGVGAGVVDQLYAEGIAGVERVNVAKRAYNEELYTNRRAELYWGLRERFRLGTIALKRDEKVLAELAAIQYRINERGLIQIEGKDDIKKRLKRSPDRADMLALLFDGAGDSLADWNPEPLPPSRAAILREEMKVW